MDRSNPTHRRARPVIEWPTILLLLICYGLWFILGYLVYPVAPVLALILFCPVIALHLSLQHEALHGHPTRHRHVNEALVGLPLAPFYPYRRYKDMHLKHHGDERLTDPYDDPESFYRARFDWKRLPRLLKILLGWNNTFIGRVLLGPALAIPGFLLADARRLRSSPRIRKAWMLHALGLAVLFLLVEGLFGMPFWLYTLTSAYGGMSLIAIRSYCEHQWSEHPNGRTIIVERSILSLLFLNNNLHLVHHKQPTVPWYELPRLYAGRRQYWHALNNGYVHQSYFEIMRAFAFKAKEPVVHPALRGSATPETATSPLRYSRSMAAGTTISAAVPRSRPPHRQGSKRWHGRFKCDRQGAIRSPVKDLS